MCSAAITTASLPSTRTAHSSGVSMAVNVDSVNQAHYEIFCRKYDPNKRSTSRDAQVGAERDRKASKGSVESHRHRHRKSAETWNVEGCSEEEVQRWPDTPLLLLTNSPMMDCKILHRKTPETTPRVNPGQAPNS